LSTARCSPQIVHDPRFDDRASFTHRTGTFPPSSGARGRRRLDFADLHRLPEDTPHIETSLQADEIITAINVPLKPRFARSKYLKIRDRESYGFARCGRIGSIANPGWNTNARSRKPKVDKRKNSRPRKLPEGPAWPAPGNLRFGGISSRSPSMKRRNRSCGTPWRKRTRLADQPSSAGTWRSLQFGSNVRERACWKRVAVARSVR
jgi:hypothetical protein